MGRDIPPVYMLHLNYKTHTSGNYPTHMMSIDTLVSVHWYMYFVIARNIISLGGTCLRYKRTFAIAKFVIYPYFITLKITEKNSVLEMTSP